MNWTVLLLQVEIPWKVWVDEWPDMFLRAHSGCPLENRMVVFARVRRQAQAEQWVGCCSETTTRGQRYWCRVTVVCTVGSSGTLDMRVKSVGFLDSLEVECEKRGGNKIPSKFFCLSNQKDGFATAWERETMVGKKLWMELAWVNVNVDIGSINSFHLPWQMQCTWGTHKIVYFLKSNSSYTTVSWFSNASHFERWRRTIFSAGGCEVSLLVCPILLGDDHEAFVITRPSLNSSYASSTTRQNTEFAWLWMCQKSSIHILFWRPRGFLQRKGDTDFRKNVSETWISWMWLYPWSVIVFMVKAVGEGNGHEGAEADSQDPRNQCGSFPLAVKLKAKSDSTTFLDISLLWTCEFNRNAGPVKLTLSVVLWIERAQFQNKWRTDYKWSFSANRWELRMQVTIETL